MAQSLARAGTPVHVIDLFGDRDTRACARTVLVAADRSGDWHGKKLVKHLLALLARWPDAAIIIGSGFDGRPALYDTLLRHNAVAGCTTVQLQRLKSPQALSLLLETLNIPAPPVRMSGAVPDRGWVQKQAGATGGAHVQPMGSGDTPQAGHYAQRRIDGESWSVLLLGDGRQVAVIGATRHWRLQENASCPYRFSGLCRDQSSTQARWMKETSGWWSRLTAATGLRGLWGADVVVDQDGNPWLIEINPRPPASFELHECHGSLIHAHVEACAGRLGRTVPLGPAPARAMAVAYAPQAWRVPARLRWPAWVSDRPRAGSLIAAQAPVCTLRGEGAAAAEAMAAVSARWHALAQRLALPGA